MVQTFGTSGCWSGDTATAGAHQQGHNNLLKNAESNNKDKNELYIFPNPANNLIHLICEHQISEVKIFDRTGKLVMTSDKIQTPSISIVQLWNGLYFIEVRFAASIPTYFSKFSISK